MSDNSFQLLQKAEHLTEIERWKDAVPLLTKYLVHNENDYDAICLLSLCYYQLDQTQKALDLAEKAISTQPDYEWGHRLRSVILSQLGRKKESLQSAEEAVRIAPYLAFSLQTLVIAYLDCNKVKKAQEIAEQMRENFPESDESYLALGLVYLRTNNPYQAELCFREALRLNPLNSLARNNLGVSLLRQESAEATKINRNDTITLFGDKNSDNAMSHFTEALKLEPNNELILDNLRNQFSYSVYVFVAISLLPFVVISFLTIPGGTILMLLVTGVSFLKLVWETRKRKKEAPKELQLFIKTMKRRNFSEHFGELKRIAHRIIIKNWQPHALAFSAMLLSFIGLINTLNPNLNSLIKAVSIIMIISSGIWLSIRLNRD